MAQAQKPTHVEGDHPVFPLDANESLVSFDGKYVANSTQTFIERGAEVADDADLATKLKVLLNNIRVSAKYKQGDLFTECVHRYIVLAKIDPLMMESILADNDVSARLVALKYGVSYPYMSPSIRAALLQPAPKLTNYRNGGSTDIIISVSFGPRHKTAEVFTKIGCSVNQHTIMLENAGYNAEVMNDPKRYTNKLGALWGANVPTVELVGVETSLYDILLKDLDAPYKMEPVTSILSKTLDVHNRDNNNGGERVVTIDKVLTVYAAVTPDKVVLSDVGMIAYKDPKGGVAYTFFNGVDKVLNMVKGESPFCDGTCNNAKKTEQS
jgi:hypothetical protein